MYLLIISISKFPYTFFFFFFFTNQSITVLCLVSKKKKKNKKTHRNWKGPKLRHLNLSLEEKINRRVRCVCFYICFNSFILLFTKLSPNLIENRQVHVYNFCSILYSFSISNLLYLSHSFFSFLKPYLYLSFSYISQYW